MLIQEWNLGHTARAWRRDALSQRPGSESVACFGRRMSGLSWQTRTSATGTVKARRSWSALAAAPDSGGSNTGRLAPRLTNALRYPQRILYNPQYPVSDSARRNPGAVSLSTTSQAGGTGILPAYRRERRLRAVSCAGRAVCRAKDAATIDGVGCIRQMSMGGSWISHVRSRGSMSKSRS